MYKIDNLSAKDVIKILQLKGYFILRQKGSHMLLKNKDNKIMVIPNHKTLKIGTTRQIIKSIDLIKQGVERLL